MKFNVKIFLTNSLLILTISLLVIIPIFSKEIPTNNSELSKLNPSDAKSQKSPDKSLDESSLSEDEIVFLAKKNEETFINGNQGVNSYNNFLGTSECYKVSREVIGPMIFEGSFSSSKTKKELLDSLKLSNEGKIGDAKFGIGLGFSFEKTFAENAKSEYHYYYSKYYRIRTFKYDPLIENVITKDAKETLNSSLKNKDQKFHKLCGDSLIRSVEEGGLVIIQVQIEFTSELVRNKFSLNGNLNLGDLFGISGSIDKNFESYNLSGKLNFKAHQVGGHNRDLMTIFPDDTTEECANSVDPKKKNAANSKKCSEFLNNINTYIHDKFGKQFSSTYDPTIYHTFKYDHTLIQGLNLPQFVQTNSQLNSFKIKYENFKSVNNYYLSKMKNFKTVNPYYGNLHSDFLRNFENFYKIIVQNQTNLTSKIFGVFQFEDCNSNEKNCTKENFDKAFKSLQNIFKQIDSLMIDMKYDWTYFIKLNNGCSVGLGAAEITVTIFPQANKKFGLRLVKTDLERNDLFYLMRWHWAGGSATSETNFEFIVDPHVYNNKAVAKKRGWSGFNVDIWCGGISGITSSGRQKQNEFYFDPKILA